MFGRVFKRETRAATPLLSDELVAFLTAARTTATSIQVTADNAVEEPAVDASIRLLAESVALLPIHMFERTGPDSRQHVTDHPIARLLASPSDWQTPYNFKLFMQTAFGKHENAYAFVNRLSDSRAVEILALENRVEVIDADPGLSAQTASHRQGSHRQGMMDLIPAHYALVTPTQDHRQAVRSFIEDRRGEQVIFARPKAIDHRLGVSVHVRHDHLITGYRASPLSIIFCLSNRCCTLPVAVRGRSSGAARVTERGRL
jgi:hypothetical protein